MSTSCSIPVHGKVTCVIACLVAAFLYSPTIARAGTFTDMEFDAPIGWTGSLAWGDYDSDGDLDLLTTGEEEPNHVVGKIFRNDGDCVFTNAGISLMGVVVGAVEWGDYDNDGDVDILMSGIISGGGIITLIYRNDGQGVFTLCNPDIPPMMCCDVAWGDYDNDGDLDILITGDRISSAQTLIYRNDGDGSFTDIGADLPAIYWSSADCGDYDNDGDLDILLAGKLSSSERLTRIYRNEGDDTFTEIDPGMIGLACGSTEWGDFDSDGDLDVLLTGTRDLYNSEAITRIYRNDNDGSFVDIEADIIDAGWGEGQWGDYDNDGDLDILISGWQNMHAPILAVYRNDGGGIFLDIEEDSLTVAEDADVIWGDVDNDGDLDFATYTSEPWPPHVKLYRNDGGFSPNNPPTAPPGLFTTTVENSLELHWDAAGDIETPAPGLTYNLRIGRSPGGVEIQSPMVAFVQNHRQIVAPGNVGHNLTWPVTGLAPGTYYWSVQASDNAYSVSPFAPEASFVVHPYSGLTDPDETVPVDRVLITSAPNPFSTTVRINYDLPAATFVTLKVFDPQGHQVAKLFEGWQTPNTHAVVFDGRELDSGLYFVRLELGATTQSSRMIRLR